jgi:hypothetical protein
MAHLKPAVSVWTPQAVHNLQLAGLMPQNVKKHSSTAGAEQFHDQLKWSYEQVHF